MEIKKTHDASTKVYAFETAEYPSVLASLERQARLVAEERNLKGNERTPLILRLPPMEKGEAALSRFFDAPFKVAGNKAFRGIFAIDISEYAKAEDADPRYAMARKICMDELYYYMAENPGPCYRLLFSCSNLNEVKRFQERFSSYKEFEVKEFGNIVMNKSEKNVGRSTIGY